MKAFIFINLILFSTLSFAGGDSISGASLLSAQKLHTLVSNPKNIQKYSLDIAHQNKDLAEKLMSSYKPSITKDIIKNSFDSDLININPKDFEDLTKFSIETSYFSIYNK